MSDVTLKDGSQIAGQALREVMGELRDCTPGDRRLLRAGAYGHSVPRSLLAAHPGLLYRDRLAAVAAAVIRNAVRQDGKLVSPL